MYIFLAKKIAIPKQARLSCVAWNSDQGWIACGGEGPLLKVLRLEAQKGDVPMARGIAAPSSLGLSQTLEGHKSGTVQVAAWNALYKKLTTSDSTGMIIVWVHHRGKWFEEMINNRNTTVVVDMRWNSEGKEICIAYRDGHVIVGGVKGNRLWGKNLGYELSKVVWSPDCRTLVFVTADSQVHTYTREGMRTGEVRLAGVKPGAGAGSGDPVAALDWYDGAEGYEDPSAPSLAIAFESGRMQMMRSTTDEEPLLVETGLRIRQVTWNCAGTVLAVAGVPAGAGAGAPGAAAGGASAGDKAGPPSVVQFYSPYGQHVRTLRVPGEVKSLSWEGGGLRLAMAVGHHVYFANVRPDYKWAVFGDTVVYAYARPDRAEQCLVFWDTESGQRHEKFLKHLLGVHAAPDGDHCLVVTRADDGSAAASMKGGLVSGLGVAGSAAAGQFLLVLFDAIGSPVETRFLRWRPQHISVTKTHVIAASESTVYVWQYRSGLDASGAGAGSASAAVGRSMAQASSSGEGGTGAGAVGASSGAGSSGGSALRLRGVRERYFHIDDAMGLDAAGKASGGRDASAAAAGGGGLRPAGYDTKDPVSCVTASRQCMLVGRASGAVSRYTLPHLVQDAEYRLRKPAARLALNCDSTVFSVVDDSGFLSFFDTRRHRVDPSTGQSVEGEQLIEERKDAWAMRWAEDSPELFASMEKTKMIVYRDCKPGDPVLSSGYLGRFRDLRVQVAMLDDVMVEPDLAKVSDCVLFHETKSLEEAQVLIESASPQKAVQYIQEHSHPRLWRLLAEGALERLDFATAEQAFVGGQDYAGIQLVKRLRRLGHNAKQKAEVHVHFGRFQDAEDAYRGMDRLDLAIEMRARVGDWARALQLASEGEADGVDRIVAECRRRIGDQLMDQQQWTRAAEELAKTDDKAALIKCYRAMDDFDALAGLVEELPDESPLLVELGRALQSAGVAQPAVEALLKAGQPQAAVDCCVLLNEWDKAIELAQTHDFPQVESLLNKYAARLLAKGQVIAAIELYRKAGRHAEAAHLLAQLAESSLAARKSPLRAKKLFVLAALEVESFRQQAADKAVEDATAKGGGAVTAATATAAMTATMMDTMLRTDATLSASTVGGERAAKRAARTLDNAWHGAEALHFWMLGQRQLYAREFDAAMATAARLAALYEDVLPARDVHSLLALAAFRAGFFGLASRAFIRLEAVAAGEDEAADDGGAGGGAKAIGGAAHVSGGTGAGVSLATAATTIMGGAETASDLAAALGAIPLPRPATAGLGMAAGQLPTEAAQAMEAGGFGAGSAGKAGVGSAASLALQAEQARRQKQRAREEYEQLAFQLFMRHPPRDPQTRMHPCPHCKEGVQGWQPNCSSCGALFSPSVASGLPIRGQPYYRCGRCKHKCLLHEVAGLGLKSCPLCHEPIDQEQVERRQSQGT